MVRTAASSFASIPSIPHRRALLILAALVLSALFQDGRLHARDVPAEQVWIVSTRRAPLCGAEHAAGAVLDYWQLDENQQWERTDREAFLSADNAAVPTSFFIHGNRSNYLWAVREGDDVLVCLRDQADGRPFRFVIWSWPADRIPGRHRQDVRIKAWRSDVQSYYLARCINQIDPRVPVATIGYSFGARIITGAAEILAGGVVAGYRLGESSERRAQPLRAVLIAAALDCDWLLPGRRNGRALGQVDRMLVTRNCCDPVLRWYPLMYHVRGPRALGRVGPACAQWLGENREKLELLDVTCSVGKNHGWVHYIHAPALRRRLAQYTFAEQSPAADATSQTPDATISP